MSGSPPPELTVVLCTRNGSSTIRRQLDAVLAQGWDRPWELLIVDNGSTDDTAGIARAYAERDPRVRVVDASARAGLSYARNVGVAHALAPSVAFVDDDDEVGAGWLAAVGAALRDAPVVASRMEYERLAEPGVDLGRGWYQSERIETMFGLPVINGGASGWWVDVWWALGGNDEWMDFTGEDTDMALRAHLDLGITPVFCPAAVYHLRRRSGPRATFRQAERYGQAHVLLYRRYGRGRPGALEPLGVALRSWLWLVRHLPDLCRPGARERWAWMAGLRLGHLHGSLRFRVRYL